LLTGGEHQEDLTCTSTGAVVRRKHCIADFMEHSSVFNTSEHGLAYIFDGRADNISFVITVEIETDASPIAECHKTYLYFVKRNVERLRNIGCMIAYRSEHTTSATDVVRIVYRQNNICFATTTF